MTEKLSILLVDDDKLLSPFVIEFLENKSFDVSHATDGEEGLSEYRKGGFDLLILDVQMPFKNGFDVATEIRTLDEATPIIFVTAEGGKDE